MPESVSTSAAGTVAPRSKIGDRLANLGWGTLGAAPLMAAAFLLTPSAKGVGTHQQLGLPPCTFLYLTGFPCAFCGMTTSWTHAAHGHVLSSITTQPMGFALFAVDVALVLWIFGSAIAGRPGFRPEALLSWIPRSVWWSALALTLGSWAMKIAVVRGWI